MCGQHRSRRIEFGRAADHLPVALLRQFTLLERRAHDANAQTLAENQHIARLRADIALELVRMHHAQGDQTVDRLGRIDGMAARHGNPGGRTHRFAAGQDPLDHIGRQFADRHADNRQRQDRLRAHGIHVGQGIGRRDAAEIDRIIDNRHEKIGGGDDRLMFVQAVHRRIIAGFGADQQIGMNQAGWHFRQNFAQQGRGNFAAAAAAVGELC